MKFSRVERLILANQMRILEALLPDEAHYLSHWRTALEHGYEIEYEDIAQNIYEPGLSKEECREVINTLSMFDFLKMSYDKLTDKTGIDEYPLTFRGYDGNNETSFMMYVEYLKAEDRFTDLLEKRSVNSHSEMREVYGRMLEKFDALTEGRRGELLTKDEIVAILDARVHPDNVVRLKKN